MAAHIPLPLCSPICPALMLFVDIDIENCKYELGRLYMMRTRHLKDNTIYRLPKKIKKIKPLTTATPSPTRTSTTTRSATPTRTATPTATATMSMTTTESRTSTPTYTRTENGTEWEHCPRHPDFGCFKSQALKARGSWHSLVDDPIALSRGEVFYLSICFAQ